MTQVASAAGGSGKPSPATHPSGAARVAGAQGGVAAQGRGGVAREAWGERGAGEEPSFSALSDVEAGSELQVNLGTCFMCCRKPAICSVGLDMASL